MNRERRYVVLKLKDIDAALDSIDKKRLRQMGDRLDEYRRKAGKPLLECVVVESDWPEYDAVWAAIEARVDHKTPQGIAEGALRKQVVEMSNRISQMTSEMNNRLERIRVFLENGDPKSAIALLVEGLE